MDIKQPTTIPFWKFSLTEWYKGMFKNSTTFIIIHISATGNRRDIQWTIVIKLSVGQTTEVF